jgi:hypothetical protein
MRRESIFLFLIPFILPATAAPVRADRALPESAVASLREAEGAYREGRYPEALVIYQDLAADGLSGWVLDYNSGNAAFRAGKLGWAVYYYERASRARPRDPDVRHNYTQVREAIGIGQGQEAPRQASALQWLTRAGSAYSLADALRVAVAFAWGLLLLGAAAIAWPRLSGGLLKVLKVLGSLALVAGLALGFKIWEGDRRPDGVLVHPAGVLSAPQPDAQELTALSGGTLLQRQRRLGDWVEVEVGEDIRGWVPIDSYRDL